MLYVETKAKMFKNIAQPSAKETWKILLDAAFKEEV